MRVPSYRRHVSGQAIVSIKGKDYYLGAFDSLESRAKYRKLITEYIASRGAAAEPGAASVFVIEATERFRFERAPDFEYRERHHYLQAFRDLNLLFGRTPLIEFGPLRFKAVRAEFVKRGWCRRHINFQAARITRFLSWCVGEELYPAAKLDAIREVPGLRAGQAPDHPTIPPVSDEDVDRTLPHLPPYARGLVELLRWSGCRPGEAVMMQPEDVNRDGQAKLPGGRVVELPGIWLYMPRQHKTKHLDIDRYIVIGQKAQKAIEPLLAYTPSGHFVFSPRPTVELAAVPHYRSRSLNKALVKACAAAGVAPWFPYQLRHLAATRIKKELGEEAAKDALGHSDLDTTSIYAERSLERAAEAMRRLG